MSKSDTVEVTLLRPFVFSSPPKKNEKLPTELRFTPSVDPEAVKRGDPYKWLPTVVEVPRFVAEHPWVKESFADGAIEDPAVTAKRLKAADEARAEERKKNAKIIRQAEEAYRRTTAGEKVIAERGASVQDELNTPVNQLGRQQGRDLDPTALERELNTPVNQLREQQDAEATEE